MDSSLHSILAAQYVQDRIAQASSARQVREVKGARHGEPRLRKLPRWVGHGARPPVAPAAIDRVAR